MFTLRASRRGPKRLRGWEALRMGGEDVYKSYYCWFEAAKQQSSKAAKQKTTKKTTKKQSKKQPNSIQNRVGGSLNPPRIEPKSKQMR